MNEIQMPFGLRDGKLLHISEVSSGLDCGCVCAGCNAQLVARKGKIKQHHFAHAADSDCATGYETALHLAAKEIIATNPKIYLPSVMSHYDVWDYTFYGPEGAGEELSPSAWYDIDKVELETRLGSIVPDVTVYIRNRPLIIEIKVTHAVPPQKLRRIKAIGLSAIEIDLSKFPRFFQIEELAPVILGQNARKRWIYNTYARRWLAARKRETRQIRKVNLSKRKADHPQMAHQSQMLRLRHHKQGVFVYHCPVSLKTRQIFSDRLSRSFISPCIEYCECLDCPFYAGRQDDHVLCAGRTPAALEHFKDPYWPPDSDTSQPLSWMKTDRIMNAIQRLVNKGFRPNLSNWVDAMLAELKKRGIKLYNPLPAKEW